MGGLRKLTNVHVMAAVDPSHIFTSVPLRNVFGSG